MPTWEDVGNAVAWPYQQARNAFFPPGPPEGLMPADFVQTPQGQPGNAQAPVSPLQAPPAASRGSQGGFLGLSGPQWLQLIGTLGRSYPAGGRLSPAGRPGHSRTIPIPEPGAGAGETTAGCVAGQGEPGDGEPARSATVIDPSTGGYRKARCWRSPQGRAKSSDYTVLAGRESPRTNRTNLAAFPGSGGICCRFSAAGGGGGFGIWANPGHWSRPRSPSIPSDHGATGRSGTPGTASDAPCRPKDPVCHQE